jgi:hypothetical protein
MNLAGPIVEAVHWHEDSEYDVLLAALGYEARARLVPSLLTERAVVRLASGFPDQHELSFQENRRWFLASGFDTRIESVAGLRRRLTSCLRNASATGTIDLAVDISSLTRSRIGTIAAVCAEVGNIKCDFWYMPARYETSDPSRVPVLSSEPAIPEFAGWSTHPERPVALILGLGYELDKAVGALEYFEPGAVWAFAPSGIDDRYDRDMERANRLLFETQPAPTQVYYDVSDPFDCFVHLESLAAGLRVDYRTLIVPFGPKIFALVSMVVAQLHDPAVGVWRLSSGAMEQARDRQPGADVPVGIRVYYDRRD